MMAKTRVDMESLRQALEWSERKIKPHRRKRLELIRQFAGSRYASNVVDPKLGRLDTPVNLLNLAGMIYHSLLSSPEPRCLVRTEHPRLKGFAKTLELALNRLATEIGLGSAVATIVQDALFGVGARKMGISGGVPVDVGGVFHDYGLPFVDPISMDDLLIDMSTSRLENVQFIGNRYKREVSWVKHNTRFDAQARAKAAASALEDGMERADRISQGSGEPERYEDVMWLNDLWVPPDNAVVTMDEHTGEKLCEIEWQGPERGPYDLLGLGEVPDQLLPLPPLAHLADLHEIANVLFAKSANQAERQKTLTAIQVAAKKDAEIVKNASDGDVVALRSPNLAAQLRQGGMEQVNMAFVIWVKGLFSWLGGNLDSLGGLSPQSQTLGQDRLLAAAANRRFVNMSKKVTVFVRHIFEDLAIYLWHDPALTMRLTKHVKGTDIEIPVEWTPEHREGDLIQYDLDIDPYSLSFRSPEERLQQVLTLFREFVLPMIPMLQQQGLAFDGRRVIETLSKLSGLEEFEHIFRLTEARMAPAAPEGLPKSPVSRREYIRTNRPAKTTEGADQAMIQSLLSGGFGRGQQAAEGARIFR